MTAKPDSNTSGSTHPRSHGFKRWVAGHGQCRTVNDRLGVKGSRVKTIVLTIQAQGQKFRPLRGVISESP